MAEQRPAPANESEAQRVNRGLADAAAEAEKRQADEIEPGGRYIINADAQGKGGIEVDSEGKPFGEKKKD